MGFFDKLFGGRKEKVAPRTLMTMKVNDVLLYNGPEETVEFVVCGKIKYSQGRYSWYDYVLDDGKDKIWLTVEEEDCSICAEFAVETNVTVEPGKDVIEVNGTLFELEENGKCKAFRLGETGNKSADEMEFWDYESKDGKIVALEKWTGSKILVYVCEEVETRRLEILPSDDGIDFRERR